MGVHAIWVPCRCGCGCGHSCNKRYGPYFIDSTRTGSTYLGNIDAATEKMAGGDPEAAQAVKEVLMAKAIDSAFGAIRKGHEILPPSERGPHLAKVHTSEGKKTVRRSRKTKTSPGTQEFWHLFKKRRNKLIPQSQKPH